METTEINKIYNEILDLIGKIMSLSKDDYDIIIRRLSEAATEINNKIINKIKES